MAFQIGFTAQHTPAQTQEAVTAPQAAPRRSLVQVAFEERAGSLAYYNDLFDLHVGDWVYVEGSYKGMRGRVVEVSYSFKIKLSAYKRVIARVNTEVHGQFWMAGRHFVSFDRQTLPPQQAEGWFKAPADDEELIVSTDDLVFSLDDLAAMKLRPEVAERGRDYYLDGCVKYLSVTDGKGVAFVEGSEGYAVEFTYQNGEIRDLVCSCYCSYRCKHEFAAMLQLRETLREIETRYAAEYAETGRFVAIDKVTLFRFAVEGRETAAFTL